MATILNGERAVTQSLVRDHSRTISAKFCLLWFSRLRKVDLKVIFCQNMIYLHNWYELAERNISQKKPGIYVELLIGI
jgi:hypothetical protein